MDEVLKDALKEISQKYAQEVANKHILIASLKDADREIKELKEELNELRSGGKDTEMERGNGQNYVNSGDDTAIATEFDNNSTDA